MATLIGRRFHVSYSVSGATRLMRAVCRVPRTARQGLHEVERTSG
ncbi:hypothetical protein [Streptomyces sp. NPDC007856]